LSKHKIKLIELLLQKKLADTRQLAEALIMEGRVLSSNQILDKPGTLVDPQEEIRIKEKLDYVSRGGLKIQSAFADFNLSIKDLKVIDVGASTGGFTDFLLKKGSSQVLALDVGYGQLSWKLRKNPRVTVLERTNIRHLDPGELPFKADIVVADVSFISLQSILKNLIGIANPGGKLLLLLKPQFEIQKSLVPAGGVIRDKMLHEKVIKDFLNSALKHDLNIKKVTFSHIKGAKGNIEYWIYLEKDSKEKEINLNYDKMVADVVNDSHNYFNRTG